MLNGELIDYVTCEQRTHAVHTNASPVDSMQMADESSVTMCARLFRCVRLFSFSILCTFCATAIFVFDLFCLFFARSLQLGPFEKCCAFHLSLDLDMRHWLTDTMGKYSVKTRLDAAADTHVSTAFSLLRNWRYASGI